MKTKVTQLITRTVEIDVTPSEAGLLLLGSGGVVDAAAIAAVDTAYAAVRDRAKAAIQAGVGVTRLTTTEATLVEGDRLLVRDEQ
jgi:hypothetical protein